MLPSERSNEPSGLPRGWWLQADLHELKLGTLSPGTRAEDSVRSFLKAVAHCEPLR